MLKLNGMADFLDCTQEINNIKTPQIKCSCLPGAGNQHPYPTPQPFDDQNWGKAYLNICCHGAVKDNTEVFLLLSFQIHGIGKGTNKKKNRILTSIFHHSGKS